MNLNLDDPCPCLLGPTVQDAFSNIIPGLVQPSPQPRASCHHQWNFKAQQNQVLDHSVDEITGHCELGTSLSYL